MLIAAAVLASGLSIEIDLSRIVENRRARKDPNVTCGIRVAGYHFRGQPGQKFRYGGETYEIPRKGSVELISSPRVKTYSIGDKQLPLDRSGETLDAFGFQWITLPTATLEGETR